MPEKQLKYGRIEAERRFLLAEPPTDRAFDREADIHDRYLDGTRLRLRRMRWSSGEVEYKLARKLPPHAPGQGVMGNLYLTEDEHRRLSILPSHGLVKRRRYAGPWGIDVFAGPLTGLVLAEAEVEDPAHLPSLQPPFPVVAEVTEVAFFQGGRLARLTAPALQAELLEWGIAIRERPD